MAYVNTAVIMSSTVATNAPSGHTQSTTAGFSIAAADVDIEENPTLNQVATGFAAATAAAGFDALFVDIDTLVQTHIGTTMGVDTTGNSVDYIATVTSITEKEAGQQYLLDANRSVDVQVNIKVKIY